MAISRVCVIGAGTIGSLFAGHLAGGCEVSVLTRRPGHAALLRGLARALGVPSRLFPVPPFLLQMFGNMTGYNAEFERLLSPLRVDSSKVCRELDWYPPYTLRQGLQATADWYRQVHRK